MEQTHKAPWRTRMVPGTAPAPTYVDDAPLFDGRPPAPPVMTADRAALAVLHAPASIASRRAALAPAVRDQEWGTGSGMADPRTLPVGSTSCFA